MGSRSSPGSLVSRVARSGRMTFTGGTLPLAGGVAVGADGTVYAVGLTAFAPTGFVARLAEH